MATLTVSEEKLVVPKKLKLAFDAADVPDASLVAQVSDGDRGPALVLLDGDDLVLVGVGGVSRWAIGGIELVDGPRILADGGEEIPITGWWYPAQAQRFRGELRERIGQPAPLAGPDSAPAPIVRPPLNAEHFAKVVGSLSAIFVIAAIASLLSLDGLGNKAGIIGISAVVVALLGIPLFICSVKLAGAKSRWTWLGVAGIVLGLAGTLVLVLGVLAAIALSNWPADHS